MPILTPQPPAKITIDNLIDILMQKSEWPPQDGYNWQGAIHYVCSALWCASSHHAMGQSDIQDPVTQKKFITDAELVQWLNLDPSDPELGQVTAALFAKGTDLHNLTDLEHHLVMAEAQHPKFTKAHIRQILGLPKVKP